jgi:hypothetical protein
MRGKKPVKKDTERRRCTQTKCTFYLEGGCKSCQDEACHAEPYIINTSCNRCLSCENVPGAIRWDDPKADKQKIGQAVQQEISEEEALKYLIAAAALRLKELEESKKEVIKHER